jgi:hypothetical protein
MNIRFNLLFSSALLASTASAQFLATMEVKEPVPGICDDKHVYVLFASFTGQHEAKWEITKEQVEERLNAEVTWLKENPKFKLKKYESVSVVVNCKGVVVRVELDSKSKAFNEQVESVFNSLGACEAGTLNGIAVDSAVLWGIEVKKGKIILR